MLEPTSHLEASIILLCGLPGSGKSTLVKDICQHYTKKKQECPITFTSSPIDETQTVIHSSNGDHEHEHDNGIEICYDQVITIDYDVMTSIITKEIIEGRANNIDCLSSSSKSSQSQEEGNHVHDFSAEELQAWRKTRKAALMKLNDELHKGADINLISQQQQQGHKSRRTRLLILMDDNFHLRSMRRDVYKQCQQFILNHEKQQENFQQQYDINIGLVIIHVDLPLLSCLENNDTRQGKKQYVPPCIIHEMASTFERPDHTKEQAKFESCTLIVDKTLDHDNHDEMETQFYHLLNKKLQTSNMEEHLIRPPIMIQKSLKQLEKEREVTLKSTMHHVDLLLRSLVGAICRQNSIFAKGANMARKSVLIECKAELKQERTFHHDDEDDNDNDNVFFSATAMKFEARTIEYTKKCTQQDKEQAKLILQKTCTSFIYDKTVSNI